MCLISKWNRLLQNSDLGVSNHYVVNAKVKVNWSRPLSVTYVCRNYCGINLDKFRLQLSFASYVCQHQPCNFDKSATASPQVPLKMVTKHHGKPTAGWLFKETVESRRVWRRLERRYHRTKTDADRIAYHSACRSTNKLISESRCKHIKLTETTDDSRKCWCIANALIYISDQNRYVSVDSTNGQWMCDSFSQFFVHKVCTIAQPIADRLWVITSIPPLVNLIKQWNTVLSLT